MSSPPGSTKRSSRSKSKISSANARLKRRRSGNPASSVPSRILPATQLTGSPSSSGPFMQTVAQWSGGNGITYYIPQIFQYAGVTDSNTSLITSGAYGVVKLAFTMLFTWGLFDRFGRRRCMLTGLFLQFITHFYTSTYMAEWRDSENKRASDAATASVFIYAAGCSIGICTVQYLYSTETYPTRIRGVCYATNMALHWFFQFAVVRVTPNMFISLDVYGAYIFWTMICAIAFVLLGIWAPETKGVPMEGMDQLFGGSWWSGWEEDL